MHGRVEATTRLTPSMVRIVLGGDGLAAFEPNGFTDAYVKVAFPPAAAPYEVPFDDAAVRERLPRELRPAYRRYTVRRWDPARRQLTLDFVVHGDLGVAGRWAARARPGDLLQLSGPSGSYRPDPAAAWYLMVGDESALPAIAASLESVPDGAPVVVRLVCDGPGHEVPLRTPGRLDVRWLHRAGGPEDAGLLPRAVREVDAPDGPVHAFVHGEAGEVRAVRRLLLGERRVPREALSASGYWRRTMTDEAWREVKAAWNAEVERDV